MVQGTKMCEQSSYVGWLFYLCRSLLDCVSLWFMMSPGYTKDLVPPALPHHCHSVCVATARGGWGRFLVNPGYTTSAVAEPSSLPSLQGKAKDGDESDEQNPEVDKMEPNRGSPALEELTSLLPDPSRRLSGLDLVNF